MSNILKRCGAWLLTEGGQQFSTGLGTATIIGTGCCFYFPHTFLVDYWRDFMHFYRNGNKLPVTHALRERFKRTLDLLEISEYDRKQYRPFMVYGFDMFSAGSYFSRFGVIIGLPITFTYLDEGRVDLEQLQLQVAGFSVPWETPEGKSLFRSMLVPEKAQMYAIAREIQIRQTDKFLMDMVNPVAMSLMAFGLGSHFNEKFNLLSKSRSLRFSMYGLLGGFFVTAHLFLKDFLQVHYEQKVDEYLAKKDPIFQEGGKQYYQLILYRNIGLRKLMGKLGKHLFTVHGNENYSIRQKHLPLVHRRDFFENYVNQA